MLLQAALPNAVAAERAFAQTAADEGQWTAFRAFAAEDATIFTPQPVNARLALANTPDPDQPLRWAPAASYVSCDGRTAVNTGPWTRADGQAGYFTTVWSLQTGVGWRWLVDAGDQLAVARPGVGVPLVRRAACGGAKPLPVRVQAPRNGAADAGLSRDFTLRWRWAVDAEGGRRFTAELWNGRSYETVVDDRVDPR
jgi:hypothetical protein